MEGGSESSEDVDSPNGRRVASFFLGKSHRPLVSFRYYNTPNSLPGTYQNKIVIVASGDSLPQTNMERQDCDFCGAPGATLRCSRCKSVAYCSRECQKGAWKEHKATCQEATSASKTNKKEKKKKKKKKKKTSKANVGDESGDAPPLRTLDSTIGSAPEAKDFQASLQAESPSLSDTNKGRDLFRRGATRLGELIQDRTSLLSDPPPISDKANEVWSRATTKYSKLIGDATTFKVLLALAEERGLLNCKRNLQ